VPIDRLTEIHIMLGQRYMRENAVLSKYIAELLKTHPDWTAQEVMNYANRELVHAKTRDSLQVHPGVVAMNQGVSGRLTPGMEGGFGTTSRNNPANAVAANGVGGYSRIEAER